MVSKQSVYFDDFFQTYLHCFTGGKFQPKAGGRAFTAAREVAKSVGHTGRGTPGQFGNF